MHISCFFTLFIFIGCATSNSFVRFLNPLAESLEISTDQFPTFTLNFTQATPYYEVTSAAQTVSVTNVMTSGASVTNNQPLLLETPQNLYYTFVAYQDSSVFYFIKYNETFDASVNQADTTMAFVRLLDVATNLGFINLVGGGNPNSADVVDYVGQWEITSYYQVSTAFTSLVIKSSSGSITVPTCFLPGYAYTIAVYNDATAGAYAAGSYFDRDVQGVTPAGTTCGSGEDSSSTSSTVTPNIVVSNTQEDSSSGKVAVVLSLAAMAVLLAF